MNSYIPIAVMMVIAAMIAGVMVFGSYLLGPKKPSASKEFPYECGMRPVGNARERFPVKFYLIAMLFIVFDIETIFLYPWAVTFHHLAGSLKIFNLIEMAVFVAILFVGYFYVIGTGALDWEEAELTRYRETPTPQQLAARASLRYGNEKSGPTNLSQTPVGLREPSYGASSQEELQHLPQANPEFPGYASPAAGDQTKLTAR